MNTLLRHTLWSILIAALLWNISTRVSPRVLAVSQGSNTLEDATMSYEELQKRIGARTEELEKINQKLDETEKNLKDAQGQRTSLQKEVKTIDYSISQLNLNIQADRITGQKLAFEIDSLGLDLRTISLTIGNKKETIGVLLKELYKNDKKNLFIIFLENKTLADSLTEVESLGNIRSQLTADIENLRNLSEVYNAKLGEVKEKHGEVTLHEKNLAYRRLIVEDQKKERQTLITDTKNRENVYQTELEELRKQQDEISDEIARFEDQLRASFDPSLLPKKRPGVFAWPIDGKRITQHFGETSNLYRGKPHNGMDIGTPLGTPVFAAESGTISAVDNNDRSTWRKYQYGKYILIKHNNNLTTLYAHLSRQLVSAGDRVERGQLIGYSGNTGYSTGPHLHLGVYWTPSIVMKLIPPAAGLVPVGVVIDPEDYL